MGKSVFIAEKPSVAQEFAKALHAQFSRKDGFLESEQYIVTWCYGHLVSMSYPEKCDKSLKDGALTHFRFYRRNTDMKLYRLRRNSLRQLRDFLTGRT